MFDVRKKVADGSVVEAFLADAPQGRVLVQVSRPELTLDSQLYRDFAERAKQLTQIQHPALLAPLEATLGRDGRFTLVSRPLWGTTAADRLVTLGHIPMADVQRWALRVCDALEFLHQHQLVHGCLTPAHLFLEGDEVSPDVMLLDTALLLFRGNTSLKRPDAVVLVPPEYLSPERVKGQRGTAASDIYGLGVLVYELLTGAPPFRAETSEATRQAHVLGGVPTLPSWLARWQPFLCRAMAREPAKRYPTVAEARAAIVSMATPDEATPHLSTPTTLVQPPPLPGPKIGPGATLGVYALEEKLGEGGMGTVYRARHKTLGRTVALKVLRPEMATNREMSQRFLFEAQALNRVKHPNMVEVFDLVHQPGAPPYFVMELLEGQSVRAAGKSRPLELRRVVRLARQAAEALAAAHEVGVLHRDIKPDNLFIIRDAHGRETLKVLDFGVACMIAGVQSTSRLTQVGQTVGTPLWMAPEQLVAGDLDGRADIYALATVMFVLLTRRFPFDGVAMTEVVMQRLSGPAQKLPSTTFLGETVPSQLRTLIAQCLERERAKRPASMEQVAKVLRQVEAQLDTPAEELSIGTRPSPSLAKVWVGLGLATAALGGTLAWLLSRL